MLIPILTAVHMLVSAANSDMAFLDRSRTCNLLAIDLLRAAAVAAAQADACGDFALKVRQSRLAINVAVAVGVDRGEAAQAFYKEYAESTASRGLCDSDRMIAVGEAFNDAAEQALDYCAIIAP